MSLCYLAPSLSLSFLDMHTHVCTFTCMLLTLDLWSWSTSHSPSILAAAIASCLFSVGHTYFSCLYSTTGLFLSSFLQQHQQHQIVSWEHAIHQSEVFCSNIYLAFSPLWLTHLTSIYHILICLGSGKIMDCTVVMFFFYWGHITFQSTLRNSLQASLQPHMADKV